jgi:hypothetical protein
MIKKAPLGKIIKKKSELKSETERKRKQGVK